MTFFDCTDDVYDVGLVSALVGDLLWTGKPPRRGTRHQDLLSLSLPRLK